MGQGVTVFIDLNIIDKCHLKDENDDPILTCTCGKLMTCMGIDKKYAPYQLDYKYIKNCNCAHGEFKY